VLLSDKADVDKFKKYMKYRKIYSMYERGRPLEMMEQPILKSNNFMAPTPVLKPVRGIISWCT
jgi:hypothetical protein